MSKLRPEAINYTIPGRALSKKEFKKMILDAEKGPFYTIPQLKAELANWKAKYS